MRKLIAVTLLLGAMAVFVASASAATSSGTTVRLAVPADVSAVPAYLGAANHFFAAKGLHVKWVRTGSSEQTIAAVAAGKADFGVAPAPTFLDDTTAQSLPLRMVSGADDYAKGGSALVTRSALGIASPSDLAGMTVAVPSLGGFAHIAFDSWLGDNSVDPTQITFVQLPSFAMPSALEAGLIDAAVIESPWSNQAKDPGLATFADPTAETFGKHGTSDVWFTSKSFAGKNRGTVKHFISAIGTSLAFAQKNPTAVRKLLPRIDQITPREANAMTLPLFTPTINLATLDIQASIITGVGMSEATPVPEALILPNAPASAG